MFGCIACTSAFMIPNQELTTLEEIDGGNVYAMTLDAWVNGRVTLDLEVDPKLTQLEDPYSPSAEKELFIIGIMLIMTATIIVTLVVHPSH